MPTDFGHPSADRPGGVVVRRMREADIDEADRVMRLAFGTFMGAPDPLLVFGERRYIRTRFLAEPRWAFTAELDGEVVGSNMATIWGSFGFFGPLSVRPDLWDRGIARQLMAPVVELFDSGPVRQAGLHTFANSTKHVGLYQSLGFWPQFLTALMVKPVDAGGSEGGYSLFSEMPESQRPAVLDACRALAGAIFEGLDVGHEIGAVDGQRLGDTVFVHDESELVGVAVCHCGAGEAGSGECFVKFGAARPGVRVRSHFERLLEACESLARDRGMKQVVAGMNFGRHDAYRTMLDRGYRNGGQGVRMHRPNDLGYCGRDVYVIDDLR